VMSIINLPTIWLDDLEVSDDAGWNRSEESTAAILGGGQ